jgi:hypothetical protein
VDVEYTRGKEVIVRKGKDGKQGVRLFVALSLSLGRTSIQVVQEVYMS